MIGEREIDGFRALTIAGPDLEAAFVPDAGLVCCSLRHRGEEILGQRHGLRGYVADHSTMGIPLLYPWANRLSADRFTAAGRSIDLGGKHPALKRDGAGLPIHGLLTASDGWRVTAHRDDGDGALLAASFEWTAEGEPLALFPFPHRFTIEARIEPGSLRLLSTVEAGDHEVPIAFGFHPYLALPGLARRGWRIELPVTEQLQLDDRGLPTGERSPVALEPGPLGERSFDDLFIAPADGASFALSGGGRRIELAMDGGYPYAQIYAPPGEALIAFEPMTAPTDALISGQAPAVAPGERFSARFWIRVGAEEP